MLLISETFQNLETGQLYLDKGLKEIASIYAGKEYRQREKKEIGVQKFFIDFWMELCR